MARLKTIAELIKKPRLRVVGLMSGTSVDGVDIAIINIDKRTQTLIAYGTIPHAKSIRENIFKLCDPKTSRVDDICHYNAAMGYVFADAVLKFCQKQKIDLETIDLIGSHGQTIYHQPQKRRFGKRQIGSTLQIGEPSIIAKQTCITTVADFRPADMAEGGQGAPLVPFADYRLYTHMRLNRAIQNIGGIANVTFLPAKATLAEIIAFDTGPGNMVIDALTAITTNGKKKYDRNGAMAGKGTVHQPLLKELLSNSFFRCKPPKTTGREAFGQDYAKCFYEKCQAQKLSSVDILATATALTAKTIADAYRQFLPVIPDEVILCGGGVHNRTLRKMLQQDLATTRILSTEDFGIHPDAKEAVSFAILAWATIKGVPNNVPAATGAKTHTITGKIIPVP